ncbi:MAG: ABC transporter permease [Ignavibacteriaceae bacterium]
MKFPFFVSIRYILSNKDSRLLNLISVITIIGIAIGVATLVVALSVLNGFENTLTQKITEFDSHVQITSFKDDLPNYDNYITNLNLKLSDEADYISPYLSELAIISSKNRKEGINIKGILAEPQIKKLQSNIIEGKIDFSQKNSLIIGKTLATKLLVKVGDKVTLFALKNDQMPSINNLPNIERFVVSGIFESGMAEYDDLLGYTDLTSAQNLFFLQNKINGIDVKLKDISKIDSLSYILRKEARFPYRVRNIYETHRNIFTWINLQKEPIPIVLGLIILVAVFNIISALLILVLEKTNAIGILKSLGAKGKQIIKIFIYQGIYLSIIGIAAGNFLAWALMSIQLKFNIIKVPSSVYFVTRVPIQMTTEIFALVSIVTFVLAFLASIIPSYFASRINPVKALRFD